MYNNYYNNVTYTKLCKYCKQQIDCRQMVCPFCGKKQKQHTFLIVLLSILGTFFALGLLGAILSSSDTSHRDSSNSQTSNAVSEVEDASNTESETENTSGDNTETINKIGDTIEITDWEITLDNIRLLDRVDSGYGTYFSPEEGQYFIIADLTVKNLGDKSNTFLGFSGVNVNLLYKDKYTLSATNLLGYADDLHLSTLNPLSSQSGVVVFDVADEVSSNLSDVKLVVSYRNQEYKFKTTK